MKSMGPAARISAGQGIAILAVQYILYLCASIALTIATGYYLWKVETNNQCSASNNGESDTLAGKNLTNVKDRFDIIMKIYFAVFITEVVRCLLMVIAVFSRSNALANLYQFTSLNDCLAFAALIILHVYRF